MDSEEISELIHRFERELQIANADDDICKIYDAIKDRGKTIEEIKLVVHKFSEWYETEFWIELYKEEPHPELDINKEHYHFNYDLVFPLDDYDMIELIRRIGKSDLVLDITMGEDGRIPFFVESEEEVVKFKQLIERIKEEVTRHEYENFNET